MAVYILTHTLKRVAITVYCFSTYTFGKSTKEELSAINIDCYEYVQVCIIKRMNRMKPLFDDYTLDNQLYTVSE